MDYYNKKIIFLFSLLLFSFAMFQFANAQEAKEDKKIIQFTGIVLNQDSSDVISGVHIYLPTLGRGTTTNAYGFFSLPVIEGDSMIFSSVGYHRVHYVVPPHDVGSSLRVLVTLKENVKFLEEVEVRPFLSEQMFKKALVSMKLPHEKEYANIYQWLNSEIMTNGYWELPNSPQENYRFFVNQQNQSYQNRFSVPTSQYLNPFAWAQFIKSLKKKKK